MDRVGQASVRRYARIVGIAALALSAAMAVSGCITIQATPEIIYITPAPRTPVPSPSAAAPSVAPSTTSTAPSTAPSPVAPSTGPSDSGISAASLTVSSETINKTAPDGRWTVTFRKPIVSGPSADAVTAMNAVVVRRVDAYITAFETSDLPTVASGDGPSTLRGDFSVAFLSPTLLSLRFTIQTYESGAASTSSVAGSLNLLASTGAAIQFVDLFTSSGAALPVLTSQAHTLLTSQLHGDLSWPSSITMADFQNAWTIKTDGLELTWNQATIAPSAAGTPSITIPWSALHAVIATSGPAGSFVA